MGLNSELLHSIHEYGFQAPTKLQRDALPPLVRGCHVVMEAPINSGKTTTACISALQKVDISNPQCQVLILNPSLETTLQTLKVTLALGSYSIHCHVCTDQAHLREDKMRLQKGSHIVVGTPSYVQEIMDHSALLTNSIRVVVFDRVDDMISEGSKDIIENILQAIPRDTQVVFLLIKMLAQLEDLTTKFMCNPAWISHDTVESGLDRSDDKLHESNQEAIDDNQDEMDDDQDEIIDSFDGMNLKSELLRGITAYGLKRPSHIQRHVIPPMLKDQDVIVEAQSGPDKYAGISIPILQKIDTSDKQCQAIVVVPSQELVTRIQEVVLALGAVMNVQCHACVGGGNVREDVNAFRNGAHVVVGTLGRVLHLISRKILRTDSVKMIIMYEMLANSYVNDMEDVFQRLPSSAQIVFGIARMNKRAAEITSKLMREPIHVTTKIKASQALGHINQFYVAATTEESKLDTLCSLCDTIAATHIVVFCNTLEKVDWLSERLIARKVAVEAIRKKTQAEEVNKGFSSGSFRVLISTDKMLGDYDVREVSLVINFDFPIGRKSYRSRVGLVGRGGKKGVAVNIVTDKETVKMKTFEQVHLTPIQEMSVEDPVGWE
ncbi:MAG: P-loop containing nucleoside triphosphate hydrolase protein [Benniella sp.]|nr:MAG: P-loop containing nucleoside triphosphate hydrolase protein [Benniella sp.]